MRPSRVRAREWHEHGPAGEPARRRARRRRTAPARAWREWFLVEPAGRCVDQNEVDVLLGRHAQHVFGRIARRERSGPRLRATGEQHVPQLVERGRRRCELLGLRNRVHQDHLTPRLGRESLCQVDEVADARPVLDDDEE